MSSHSAEVANSTSSSMEGKIDVKNAEKILSSGEKRSHDNSGTYFKILKVGHYVITIYFTESEIPSKISRKELNNFPTRQYLDATVVPILLEALAQVAKERPKEPIDYLITYLQNHKSEHNNQVTD